MRKNSQGNTDGQLSCAAGDPPDCGCGYSGASGLDMGGEQEALERIFSNLYQNAGPVCGEFSSHFG